MQNQRNDPSESDTPPAAGQASHGGDSDFPGKTPPEVPPGEGGDTDRPDRSPLEEPPGGGDMDQPGETPQEMPAQPIMPNEAPPPD